MPHLWKNRFLARWALLVGFASLLLVAAVPRADAASSAKPLKVVQLGDSYSAGNGAGSYYGPKGCYRSTESYARKWVRKLRAAHNVTFVNRACSGGVLDNLDKRRFMDESIVSAWTPEEVGTDDPEARRAIERGKACSSPYRDDESFEFTVSAVVPQAGGTLVYALCTRYMNRQWDAVDESTDVVILTIGGNDLEFAKIVEQCFAWGYRDPHECKDRIDAANRSLPGLSGRIESFLRRLKGRMRDDAKILLLSYPHLEKREELTLGKEVFGVGTVYPVGREVRALGRRGDEEQGRAVRAVNAENGPRVLYLDAIKGLFAGHEPDGRATEKNEARWLHEPTDSFIRYEWYHYNGAGHDAIGTLLGGYGDFGAGHTVGTGAAGIDVVFAIDTSGSMGSSIDSVKETAAQLVSDISAKTTSARFALIDYRDFPERTGDPEDYPAKLQTDFTTDSSTITSAIEGLGLGYGGDTPETMFSALHMAYGLTWRPGVKKLVVVLADAPPLSPEPISGLTAEQITAESLAIDPAEVHLVDVGGAVNQEMTAMAEATNGGVYASSESGAAQEIADVVDRSIAQPYAWAEGPYVGRVGDTVTLDGSGSYGIASDVVKWEWDVDGDGTYDIEADGPMAQHTYTSQLDALVALRVTDADGRTGLATTPVRMSDDGDEVSRELDNCAGVANPGQEDEDADGVGDLCDPTPGFPVADRPGVFEGTTATTTPPGPGAPVPTLPKPKARSDVRLGKVRLSGNRRRLVASVRCTRTSGTCRGRLTLRIASKKVHGRYRVRAGKTGQVRFRLPARVRRAIAARRVRITVTARTAEGATATLKLRLPRMRARR